MSKIIRYDESQVSTTMMRSIGDAVNAGYANILLDDIKKLISRAIAYRGPATTDKDLNAMAGFYLADLQEEFSWLDMKEIEKIFHLGIRGKLGEFFGINAGTLYDWTSEYCKSQRADYIRQRQEEKPILMLEQKTEVSQEDSDAIVMNAINSHYEEYRASLASPGPLESQSESFGDILSIARKCVDLDSVISKSEKRYQIGHPLCDPADYQINWLHAHGFTGTLKEIFDKAIENGKETLL